jgi:hypothetical protein
MKYYSEEAAEPLRLRFEEKVLRWSKVSAMRMFGCPCYKADGKLFAFLVTNGIVITCLAQADRETVSRGYHATAFRSGTRVIQKWMRVPIERMSDLDRVVRFVRRSYESARLEDYVSHQDVLSFARIFRWTIAGS